MDINAAQTDGQTRALAWLDTNLGAASTEVAVPATQVTAAPSAVTPVPVEVKPGIADAIRKDREARAMASAAQTEAAKYKNELEALRKDNEQLKSLGLVTDPFEFLKGRKLSKEQQALWGQAFLYDLKPEVAPPEFRLDLYKAEQSRKEAERADQAQREKAEQDQQGQQAQLSRYANEIFQHVKTASGSCPESELWFTEDGPDGQVQVNHEVYAQSLLATANNLVRRAQAQGQQADLNPANVSKVLEQEVSKRMARRDAKMASITKSDTKQVVPASLAKGGEQTTVTSTTSAEGLRGGSPNPLDMSEAARRARAIVAAWGTK